MENKFIEKYYIEELNIKKLWGVKDFFIGLDPNVNIIIGPNASGKTTILNILFYALTADLSSLLELMFEEILIKLRTFDNLHERTVRINTGDGKLNIKIGTKAYKFDIDDLTTIRRPIYQRRIYEQQRNEVVNILGQLVPAVWLPVSRRLPVPEDESRESRVGRRTSLESVDEKLRQLQNELINYRLKLDTQLNTRYKQFEKSIFQLLLYDKAYDAFDLKTTTFQTGDDKPHLLSAFRAAGVLDTEMRKRIDSHFDTAEKAAQRMSMYKLGEEGYEIEDLFILPLIRRTGSMISLARGLEKDREEIFSPIMNFESIVRSFIKNKNVHILDDGRIQVTNIESKQAIGFNVLSSGEKQILILLIQALLWEDRPVVYVTDEPELSLHVAWQEKLIQSLIKLGGEMQIIIATHSPDIIANFRDKVIDLEKASK
ncbi:AAA family ATPase [Chloroflexota bacterium]